MKTNLDSKTYLTNQYGHVTFVGILITLGVIAMLFSNWTNRIHNIKNQEIRMNTLLCFKEHVELHQKLVEFIERANLMIAAATPGLVVPKTAAISRMIINIAKHAQTAQLINTNRLALGSKRCQKHQIFSFLKNIPYHTQAALILKRNKIEQAILKETKWDYSISAIYPNRYFSLSFSLQAEYSLKNYSVLKVKTSEKTIKDLLSLK